MYVCMYIYIYIYMYNNNNNNNDNNNDMYMYVCMYIYIYIYNCAFETALAAAALAEAVLAVAAFVSDRKTPSLNVECSFFDVVRMGKSIDISLPKQKYRSITHIDVWSWPKAMRSEANTCKLVVRTPHQSCSACRFRR